MSTDEDHGAGSLGASQQSKLSNPTGSADGPMSTGGDTSAAVTGETAGRRRRGGRRVVRVAGAAGASLPVKVEHRKAVHETEADEGESDSGRAQTGETES